MGCFKFTYKIIDPLEMHWGCFKFTYKIIDPLEMPWGYNFATRYIYPSDLLFPSTTLYLGSTF